MGNIMESTDGVGKRCLQNMNATEALKLAEEVLPARLVEELRIRSFASSEDKAFNTVIDPTSLEKIRGGLQEAAERRLAMAGVSPEALQNGLAVKDWVHPQLTGGQLAIGITGVVFISAAELLLNLDLFIPGMNLPGWIHAILFVPAGALGVTSCSFGLSFWCDYFLGALGLNALDAILLFSGLTAS